MTLFDVTTNVPAAATPPHAPLPAAEFNRLKDALYAAAEASFIQRWGSRDARRKGTLLGLLSALIAHKRFAFGVRVAYPIPKLSRALRKDTRSVERAISELRSFPELVSVVRIGHGEIAWNGRPCRIPHLEYETGVVLRAVSANLSPGVVPVPTRHDAPAPPGITPPDPYLDIITDQISLKAPAPPQPASPYRLNLIQSNLGQPLRPSPPATEAPPPPPPPTATHLPKANRYPAQPQHAPLPRDACSAPRPHDPRPPCKARSQQPLTDLYPRRLAHPVQLLATIIRTVLGLGNHVPIHQNEFHLVDGALQCVSGEFSPEAIPHLIDEVLALALRDHAHARGESRTSRERPTLAYVFGGPHDAPHQPHRFFLDRVTQLRERKHEEQKHQLSQDYAKLGRLLFGGPESSEPKIRQPLPTARGRSVPLSRPVSPRRSHEPTGRVSAADIAAALAQVEASWAQPAKACAG